MRAIISLGGPIAEERFAGAIDDGSDRDFESVARQAARLGLTDDDQRAAFRLNVERQTREIIDYHWLLVEAVAAALCERYWLTDAQLKTLIDDLTTPMVA